MFLHLHTNTPLQTYYDGHEAPRTVAHRVEFIKTRLELQKRMALHFQLSEAALEDHEFKDKLQLLRHTSYPQGTAVCLVDAGTGRVRDHTITELTHEWHVDELPAELFDLTGAQYTLLKSVWDVDRVAPLHKDNDRKQRPVMIHEQVTTHLLGAASVARAAAAAAQHRWPGPLPKGC